MAYEQRDNSGTIFKNEKREKDTHPHGNGKCMVGGVEYYISAWTKEGNNGRFQSLAFKPVEQQQTAPAPKAAAKQAASGGGGQRFAEIDDDVPFAPYAAGKHWNAV